MDVAAEERRLTTALAAWAAGSVAAGALLAVTGARTGRPTLTAFGRQHLAWGLVDGAIAGTSLLRSARRGPEAPDEAERRGRRLHRLLVVNTGLDVGYLVGAVALLAAAGRLERRHPGRGPRAVGAGTAVLVQAGFLLSLDADAARRTRAAARPS